MKRQCAIQFASCRNFNRPSVKAPTAHSVGNRAGKLHEPGDWQPKLGIVTFYLGDVTMARQILHDCLQLWLDLKNNVFLARIYGYLAEVALSRGEFAELAHAVAQSMRYQASVRWLSTEVVDCLWVAARLATAQQQYPRAATLFGLAEQVRRRIHYAVAGLHRPPVDAALALTHNALGEETFAAAFAAGQQLSLAEAFASILAVEHITGAPPKV